MIYKVYLVTSGGRWMMGNEPNIVFTTDKPRPVVDMLACLFAQCHENILGLCDTDTIMGNMYSKLNYNENKKAVQDRKLELRTQAHAWVCDKTWRNYLLLSSDRLKYIVRILRFIQDTSIEFKEAKFSAYANMQYKQDRVLAPPRVYKHFKQKESMLRPHSGHWRM
jgi:hypothetical protein